MLLTNMSEAIGDILVSNGVKILGETVKGSTEVGLRKINDFVKDKTGVDLFEDSAIFNNGLSDQQVIDLKKLELDYETQLNSLAVEYAKIAAQDIADARKMQQTIIASDNGGWLSKNYIYLFASFWSIMSAGLLISIIFCNIPPENQRYADTIIGFILGTLITSILSYFFGNNIRNAFSKTTIDH